MQALEEVVRQQRVFGHAVFKRRDERIHVVEPLAREDALAEQVLVRVRHRGGIRIHACMAGVDAGEERSRRTCYRHAHPGLQDAVALGDPPEAGIEVRTIQGMGDDADELPRRVAWQARVAVQRDDITNPDEELRIADMQREAGVAGAAQKPVELLELATLALPPDPGCLAGIPLPHAVQQVKGAAASRFCACVEPGDALARRGEDAVVAGHFGRGCVREVAEDGEVNVRVGVAERQHLEVLQQLFHPGNAGEQRGDDDHCPVLGRHSCPVVDAGKSPRR